MKLFAAFKGQIKPFLYNRTLQKFKTGKIKSKTSKTEPKVESPEELKLYSENKHFLSRTLKNKHFFTLFKLFCDTLK